MNKSALITGASGGLGLEMARIFAREGYDLVLVARREDKLVALKSELEAAYRIKAAVFAKDLSQKDAANEVFSFTEARGILVDILVNNAGFGDYGPFTERAWQKQYEMVQLNITALMQLTHCYLKPMLARQSGKILNIASVASFQPGPLMSVYYATKAFVLSFTEALSVELRHSGITVTALCPGPTKTGFEEKAELNESGLFKNLKTATAKEVAEYGYRQMQKNRVIAIQGFRNRSMLFMGKLAPRKLVRRFVYGIQKRRS